ncbi:MAG: hypothetical protein ACM3XM_01045 [Mycobacterium leprae]
MASPRACDTYVVRIRREQQPGGEAPPVERWQVEHVQTGLKVYVHDLDDVVAVIRSSLSQENRPRRSGNRAPDCASHN